MSWRNVFWLPSTLLVQQSLSLRSFFLFLSSLQTWAKLGKLANWRREKKGHLARARALLLATCALCCCGRTLAGQLARSSGAGRTLRAARKRRRACALCGRWRHLLQSSTGPTSRTTRLSVASPGGRPVGRTLRCSICSLLACSAPLTELAELYDSLVCSHSVALLLAPLHVAIFPLSLLLSFKLFDAPKWTGESFLFGAVKPPNWPPRWRRSAALSCQAGARARKTQWQREENGQIGQSNWQPRGEREIYSKELVRPNKWSWSLCGSLCSRLEFIGVQRATSFSPNSRAQTSACVATGQRDKLSSPNGRQFEALSRGSAVCSVGGPQR